MPGDSICYSCGRLLSTGNSKTDGKYSLPNTPKQFGVVKTKRGRNVNILRKRKNRFRSLFMLAFISFIMFSPASKEALFGGFTDFESLLNEQIAPYHTYPVESTYSLEREIALQNTGPSGYLLETVPIPLEVSSLHESETMFLAAQSNGADISSKSLQKVNSVSVLIDGETITIPTDGSTRERASSYTTNSGHEVWWPSTGSGEDLCLLGPCIKVRVNMPQGSNTTFSIVSEVTSTSYSWWESPRVSPLIEGSELGSNLDRSGDFSDITNRASNRDSSFYTSELWYDRGSQGGWAIDAQHAEVQAAVRNIEAMLPEGESENAYAFARSAFDYLHANIQYDTEADAIARSGPTCLADGLGDCDEQTNAFLSILRAKGIPGWYVFGALTDSTYSQWEAHAWGMILLPMSDEWCDEQGIQLDSCFIEAAVDVVNNKWLLHTPTAYIDWIELYDTSGEKVNSYYRPVLSTPGINRVKTLQTYGEVDQSGGLYKVKLYPESLR